MNETEIENIQTQNKTLPPVTVEECFVLSVGDLGRGLLRSGHIKSGKAYLSGRLGSLHVAYSVKQGIRAEIRVGFIWKKAAQVQTIVLDSRLVGFGYKPYFLCGFCSTLCTKLYLRPDSFRFFCRQCGELTYEIQYINRRGGFLSELHYRLNRALKLERLYAGIHRKIYRNQVTRKLYRWAIARQKWLGTSAMAEVERKKNEYSCHNI